MSVADSFKNAGQSILNLAKEFGNKVDEERAVRPAAAAPESKNFLEQGRHIAQDVLETVRRAAEATAASDAFAEAKENVSQAFTQARDEINEKLSKNSPEAADDNIVEGEIIRDPQDPHNNQ